MAGTILFGLHSRQKLTATQVLFLCRSLQALMHGGFSFHQALQLISVSTADKVLAESTRQLCEYVSYGLSIGDACKAAGNKWPALLPLALDAVQGTGKAPEVLGHLADAFALELQYRSDIKQTLLVPILTGIGALCVLGFATYVCLEHAGTSAQVMYGAHTVWEYSLQGIVGLLIAVMGVKFCLARSAGLRELVDVGMLHIPFLGSMIARAYAIILFTFLGILLRAGVPLVNALVGVNALMRNAYLHLMIERLITDLKSGVSLREAAQQIPGVCMPSIFVASVITATNAQQLAVVCDNTAKVVSIERAQAMTRFIALLQPALMLGIGLVIALFVQMLYQTLSSSLSSLM